MLGVVMQSSETIAARMRALARQEAPAREAREWGNLYALQDEQKVLGGVRMDLQKRERDVMRATARG